MTEKRRADRRVKPRRHSSGLWFACIGPLGKDGRAGRVYAPREVDSERKAYRWLEERESAMQARKVAVADVSVYWLCQLYLQDAEARVRDHAETPDSDDGLIHPHHYKCLASALTLVWETEPAPGADPLRDRPASAVTSADLDGCVAAWRRAKYSPNYVRSLVRALRAAYRWGARDVAGREPARVLAADPLAGYVAPKVPAPPDRYVDGPVVRRFVRWAWARARAGGPKDLTRRFERLFLLMFRFGTLTGVRPKEACRLKWSHLDRANHIAVFPGKATWKTGKMRIVDLTPPVWRILRAVERLEGHHPEFVFTHMRGKDAGTRGEGSAEAGEPWPDGSASSKKLRKLLLDAIDAGVAGLDKVGPKRIVQYTNRHNLASRALMGGMTASETAEILGNTADVVAKYYGHIQREHTARRANELAARRGKSRGK